MPSKQPTKETVKESPKAEAKPATTTSGHVSLSVLKAFVDSLTEESTLEEIQTKTIAFLNQVDVQHTKIEEACNYLLHRATRNPQALPPEDLEKIHKQFPTVGVDQVKAAEAKGESVDSLLDKVTLLHEEIHAVGREAAKYSQVRFFNALFKSMAAVQPEATVSPAKKAGR